MRIMRMRNEKDACPRFYQRTKRFIICVICMSIALTSCGRRDSAIVIDQDDNDTFMREINKPFTESIDMRPKVISSNESFNLFCRSFPSMWGGMRYEYYLFIKKSDINEPMRHIEFQ